MGITVYITGDARETSARVLARASAGGAETVLVLPSNDEVLARRRDLAAAGSLLRFGVRVATLASWVADVWELYGDGRAIVGAVESALHVRCALAEANVQMAATPGVVDALAHAFARGAGLPAFGAAVAGSLPEGCALIDSEERVLAVARAYEARLAACGLVEQGAVLCALDQAEVAWPAAVVVEGATVLAPDEAAFFAQLAKHAQVTFCVEAPAGSRFDVARAVREALEQAGAQPAVEVDAQEGEGADTRCAPELRELAAALYHPDASHPVAATGAVRAVLPAGRYARARLLAEALAGAGEAVVSCTDPALRFEELAPRLVPQGAVVEASYSRRFDETDFGGALLTMSELVAGGAEEPLDTFAAADLVLGSVVGRGVRTVYALDRAWRRNRLATCDSVLGQLCDGAPEVATALVKACKSGRFVEALDAAEAHYYAVRGCTQAFRAEQLAAVRCARRVFEAAHAAGAGVDEALSVLATQRVRLQVRAGGQEQADARDAAASPTRVRVMGFSEAARCAPGSVDVVVAADLNASDQPIRENRTSIDVLFEKLGCACERDPLFENRVRLLALVRAARRTVLLERALNNTEADPAYPAVMFEDVVDCYRTNPANARELDKVTSLAPALLPFALTAGEETLEENLIPRAGARAADQESASQEANAPGAPVAPAPDFTRVGVAGAPYIALPRANEADGRALLSPSSIESYLECPHKWFSLRRLRLAEVDARFSAREQGTFAHAVLHTFHERYSADHGGHKPRVGDLATARPVFDDVFTSEAAHQFEKDPRNDPLIPLTQRERRQMDDLRSALHSFLERDAALLPAFEPAHFEFAFGGETPVEYAGVRLHGSIDRLDVDAQGRAVVIDYKSSLSADYHLLPSQPATPFALPTKVQTLIYAQAVRRTLGLDVVGALYVHMLRPGSQPVVCGAYDDRVLGPHDLLDIPPARNALSNTGFATFGALLDAVEDLVGAELEHLLAGEIAPCPRTPRACDFCPVSVCEGRTRS